MVSYFIKSLIQNRANEFNGRSSKLSPEAPVYIYAIHMVISAPDITDRRIHYYILSPYMTGLNTVQAITVNDTIYDNEYYIYTKLQLVL